jgi:addiction module HigA family antidote
MAKATLSPGAALKKQLDLYNLPVSKFAEGIKISPSAARSLVNNKIRISVPFAQRLSKFFGKTPEYWVSLQNAYELAELSADAKNAAILKSITGAVKVSAQKKPAVKRVTKKAASKKDKAPARKSVKKTTTKASPERPRTKKA